MSGHKIYARHSGVKKEDRLSIPLIKRCVSSVLCIEGVGLPCEVSVLITDDHIIRGINLEFRGIDKATDVLSFPMVEFSPAGWADPGDLATDPDSGLFPLGEIVISAQRVAEQAHEYSHTLDRETAYLTVHSVLHLLGYDHEDDPAAKRLMRNREKIIMMALGLK